MGFDIDSFVAACRMARCEPGAPERIAQIVRQAIADPIAVAAAVKARQAGKEDPPMAEIFVNDDDLTIYSVAFPPALFGVPHDHAGWAVIGVYSGTEGFNLYEETPHGLRQTGRQLMHAPNVAILPPDLIHDIDNPAEAPSGSIHVYSNRHFDMPGRRIWRDGAAWPEPFSLERSAAWGMERTQRRRRELGLPEAVAPRLPEPPPREG